MLVATPMVGGSFSHSVVLVLSHTEEGAMGLILNQPLQDVSYGDVYEQLELRGMLREGERAVHFGGPVEMNRGFVLYPREEDQPASDAIMVGDVAISTSTKLLEKIAAGEGPGKHMLTIGYAGWGPGQLEQEIEENSWLIVPADQKLIFDKNHDTKWERAAFSLGVDPGKLSTVVGHA
jgi:putative transcriptional regulator